MHPLKHLDAAHLQQIIDAEWRWISALDERDRANPHVIRGEGGIAMFSPEALAWSIAQGDPREEGELREMLEALNQEQRAELVALMWYGRNAGGDQRLPFEKQWPDAAREAASPGYVSYVMKAPLARYLEDGKRALARKRGRSDR